MPLTTKTFPEIVVDLANGYGAALKIDPSLRPGDPALAMFEPVATQIQIQQENILAVLAFARASTAVGADLDSFVNEFGFSRLPAQKATGVVTLSLLLPHEEEVLVEPGSIVQTKTGDIQFQIIGDTTKVAWDANRSVYVFTPGQTQISAQVEALLPGSSSNVLSNQLIKFVSSGEGPELATNPQPLTNGIDQESDQDCRIRFVDFINSRSLATVRAIRTAITSLRVNIKVAITENKDAHGRRKLGYVLVVMDDGTGAPPDELIEEAQEAADEVRGASIEVEVIGPTIVNVTCSCNVKVDPDFLSVDVTTAVDQALVDYINTRAIGETLYISNLMKVAGAVAGVIAVQPNSMVIDTVEQDFVVEPVEVIKTNNVTVGTY